MVSTMAHNTRHDMLMAHNTHHDMLMAHNKEVQRVTRSFEPLTFVLD